MAAPRVLVADPDVGFLETARASLEEEGYVVEVVPDGREALHRAEASAPALLVTAIRLPGMDAWKLVKKLRAKDGLEALPAIFLSERSTDTVKRAAMKVGVDDVLLKPVHPETLAFRVARALARRHKTETTRRTLKEASDAQRALVARPGAPRRPAALSRPAVETAPTDTAALSGDLEHIGLATVLSMLDVEHKTGRLTCVNGHDGAMGWFELRSGRVLRAEVDDGHGLQGRDAVLTMMGWAAGAFRFYIGPVDGTDQIGARTTELLIESARSADESARLESIAPVDAGPRRPDAVEAPAGEPAPSTEPAPPTEPTPPTEPAPATEPAPPGDPGPAFL